MGYRDYNYSGNARFYNLETFFSGYSRVPRRLVNVFMKAVKGIDPNLSVLDFGCGTGRLTTAFLSVQEQLDITGMEPCRAMLDKYEAKFGDICDVKQGGYDRWSKEIKCTDSKYDVVASAGVLDHIGLDEDLAKEFMRITKPGGYLVLGYERNTKEDVPERIKKIGTYYKKLPDRYVQDILEQSGARVLLQEKMIGYVRPRVAKTGIVIAQKL